MFTNLGPSCQGPCNVMDNFNFPIHPFLACIGTFAAKSFPYQSTAMQNCIFLFVIAQTSVPACTHAAQNTKITRIQGLWFLFLLAALFHGHFSPKGVLLSSSSDQQFLMRSADFITFSLTTAAASVLTMTEMGPIYNKYLHSISTIVTYRSKRQ